MRKTQITDLITTIQKTKVSYIAIVVFIALGLAFYGGIAWSVDHTEQSFTQTYQDCRMQALLVTDILGFTDEQISELKAIDGVDDAEGCNIIYRFLHCSGVRQQAIVWQIPERTDYLINVEGEIPSAAGQVAVLRSWAENNNIKIGDKIELESSNSVDYAEFKNVRTVAQWDRESIDSLLIDAEDSYCLTSGTLTVTALVDSPVYLSTNPSAHGICAANGLYVDAVFFVSEEEMPSDNFGGYTSVILYSKNLNEINCFSDEYSDYSHELSDRIQTVVDGWDCELIDDFIESVKLLRSQLDAYESKTGTQSADGEIAYEFLSQIQEELIKEDSFCCITESATNNSFLTADILLEITKSLQSVLGITFLAVGILVCYSVISRLVADSTIQIGTRRALGFYKKDILALYLLYVASAVILGGIIGVVLGIFGIELAFVKVFSSMFTFTELPLICNLSDILPIFLVVLSIILVTTALICIAITRKKTVDLLKGEQEGSRKNTSIYKSRIFRNLSLLNKTILLNLLQDKRRVIGMIIGIAGATMLISAGICFYLNFTTAFEKQFTNYYQIDYEIRYDASSETASQEIKEVLDRHGLDYAEIYSSSVILYTPDGGSNAPLIIVPANTEDLSKIMTFDTDSASGISYDSGVWMPDYYQYSFDASSGSLLDIKMLDGRKATVPIDRFYKFHLTTPVIVMDADSFSESFGCEASPNAFYVASADFDIEKLDEELQDIDGYIYVYDFYESFQYSFSSEKMVVTAFGALFIILAVLMALMIIINLINVYISEKKNEMIILMINGYDQKFAKRYIYQDTIVLTFIGIVIGLILGSILGDQTLTALESNSMRMLHGINWWSCIAASAAVAGLIALICRHALHTVEDFKLSDINKA